jgi:hypothetical protein
MEKLHVGEPYKPHSSLYRVIQEERPKFWEVIISLIVKNSR